MTPQTLDYAGPVSPSSQRTLFGHPLGLYLLFIVEMWERFSYYGMRGLLILYLVRSTSGENPGRGWSKEAAGNLYGWYTGMAYLLPMFGGLIADKLIGTHRSMVLGSIIIALGHVALAVSGLGGMSHTPMGMSIFVFGLVMIVVGTGHFKPTVSVMVGQLYPAGDPRRDGAFTIFYMGINVGAFICPFICGTLGEKVGWHWGFGAAAVGMMLGLGVYLFARPYFLKGVGLAPEGMPNLAPYFVLAAFAVAGLVALAFHGGALSSANAAVDRLLATRIGQFIPLVLLLAVLAAAILFVSLQRPGDRGPVATILIFIIFNAIFWLAFEQAGSSLNLFAEEMTNRWIGNWEVPATWFQSVGALEVVVLAPVFAGIWTMLGRRKLNPSQAMKIAISLLFLGGGYVFMVLGSLGTTPVARASMFWLIATYTLHTFGELCISPTGLSFVSRTAPARFLTFLMGVWFLSNAAANKLGGQIAGQIENIEKGQLQLFWYRWFKLGGQADFFLVFVISSVGAGLLVLVMTPWLRWLARRPEDGRGPVSALPVAVEN